MNSYNINFNLTNRPMCEIRHLLLCGNKELENLKIKWGTRSVPVGGDNFIEDIAIGASYEVGRVAQSV